MSLDSTLQQWGALWDLKLPVSGHLWLCMEDELGGRVEKRSPPRGQESLVGPGLRWGLGDGGSEQISGPLRT